jgi:hypothetical protein
LNKALIETKDKVPIKEKTEKENIDSPGPIGIPGESESQGSAI